MQSGNNNLDVSNAFNRTLNINQPNQNNINYREYSEVNKSNSALTLANYKNFFIQEGDI